MWNMQSNVFLCKVLHVRGRKEVTESKQVGTRGERVLSLFTGDNVKLRYITLRNVTIT